MSWLSKIFGSGIVKEVGEVVDKFHTSTEEKQQMKIELEKVIQKRESEIEETVRANLKARERIIVAEMQQEDNYTKRARPTVVYFGLFIIFANYFVIPLATMLAGSEIKTFELPVEFWTAWGGIVATWAVGRSFEKTGRGGDSVSKITGSKKKNRISLLDD